MADNLNREVGMCPFCGHEVERQWVLCDNCGQRLPWATHKIRKSLNDLSDEELALRFAANTPRDKSFWVIFTKSCPGRVVVLFAALLVAFLLVWKVMEFLFL